MRYIVRWLEVKNANLETNEGGKHPTEYDSKTNLTYVAFEVLFVDSTQFERRSLQFAYSSAQLLQHLCARGWFGRFVGRADVRIGRGEQGFVIC